MQEDRTTSRSVRIVVTDRPSSSAANPQLHFVVTPSRIRLGQAIVIGWASVGFDSWEAAGSDPKWSGAKKAQGRQPLVPKRTGVSTYSLTCRTAEGRSVTKTGTLRVDP